MDVPMPSLLMITRNLPPLRGGMERLNARMVAAVAADHHVTVMAPKGSRLDSASSVRLLCCPWNGLIAFLVWATVAGVVRAVVEKPRWVIGGSGLVAPAVHAAGWLSGAHRGLYLHGLDIVVRSRLYRAFWLPTIRRMHLCMVNSRSTRDLAVAAGVEPTKVRIVFPGVTMPDFENARLAWTAAVGFRNQYKLGEGPIILSVGRLTRRKGLAEFVEHAMPSLLATCEDIRLVIIGDDAPDALNASGVGQRQRIVKAAIRAGVDAAVHLLGPVSESVLHSAFHAASVHVFPGIDVFGDVEGFGMVAIEAAAHGVPTVAFAVGGIPDAVDDPCSGALVAAGDYQEIVARLQQRIESRERAPDTSCRKFAARFAWSVFDSSVRDLLVSEVAR